MFSENPKIEFCCGHKYFAGAFVIYSFEDKMEIVDLFTEVFSHQY